MDIRQYKKYHKKIYNNKTMVELLENIDVETYKADLITLTNVNHVFRTYANSIKIIMSNLDNLSMKVALIHNRLDELELSTWQKLKRKIKLKLKKNQTEKMTLKIQNPLVNPSQKVQAVTKK